jgi:hypothetical protein
MQRAGGSGSRLREQMNTGFKNEEISLDSSKEEDCNKERTEKQRNRSLCKTLLDSVGAGGRAIHCRKGKASQQHIHSLCKREVKPQSIVQLDHRLGTSCRQHDFDRRNSKTCWRRTSATTGSQIISPVSTIAIKDQLTIYGAQGQIDAFVVLLLSFFRLYINHYV